MMHKLKDKVLNGLSPSHHAAAADGESDPTNGDGSPAVADDEADGSAEAACSDEARALAELRQAVGADGVDASGVDDATLSRFLRARSMRVHKAAKLYVGHVRWRKEYLPQGRVLQSEIANELAADKCFLQGHDKAGRPIIVVHGCKHDAAGRNLDEFKRYCVFNVDQAVDNMQDGIETFCAILDLQNVGFKNLDSKALIAIFDFLQAQYPERLGRLFMIHVPTIFWGIWKMVSPFVDKATRQKASQILFVEDKRLMEALLEEIDLDQLPKDYGGKLDLVPIELAARSGPPAGSAATAPARPAATAPVPPAAVMPLQQPGAVLPLQQDSQAAGQVPASAQRSMVGS
eukprot:SM000113S24050  [mRNA]  locus=s113:170811:173166:- [translate_table: standard]